jgi:hypothetical protein
MPDRAFTVLLLLLARLIQNFRWYTGSTQESTLVVVLTGSIHFNPFFLMTPVFGFGTIVCIRRNYHYRDLQYHNQSETVDVNVNDRYVPLPVPVSTTTASAVWTLSVVPVFFVALLSLVEHKGMDILVLWLVEPVPTIEYHDLQERGWQLLCLQHSRQP